MMNGRIALVTGGSTGIGYAVAEALAKAGANVTIAGRDAERGRRAADALGVRFTRADVRDEASVRDLVHSAASAGGIDFFFNNAGIEGALGALTDYPADSVDDILATNVKGVFLCLKHVLPGMLARGRGVIVNTASFVGTVVPFPDGAAYGASKAAVLSLTATVAAMTAGKGVTAFAVCPWITDTPMIDRLTSHQAEAKRQFAAVNPSGRIASPEDVAGVVLRLFAGEEPLESGGALLIDSGGATKRVRPLAV